MTRLRWFLALVGVMALSLAACSSSESEELDVKKATNKIDQLASRVYGREAKVGAVTCPNSVPLEKSLVFFCTVKIDRAPLRIRLKQTNAKGNVRIEQADALIFTDKLVDFVTSYANAHDLAGSRVDCGTASVITGAPGSTIKCDVTFADGTKGASKVVINDTDGKVGLESIKPTG